MKKMLTMSLLLGAITVSKAQDFKKVSNMVTLAQYESAKPELEKVMADPKAQAKPDGWMWKARIYAAFYKNDALRAKYPGSETVANEAFMKYSQMDPTYAVMTANNAKDIPFDIYTTSFKEGVRTFNAKKWDSAVYYFRYAIDYSDIIFKNKWSSNPNTTFDTTSILYAGYAAQNQKNYDEANREYSRLAEAKIGGDSYEDIYKFLLVTASNAHNKTAFDKFYALAKEVYPKENWEDYELDFMNKAYTLQQKSDMYDKEDAAGTLSEAKYLQYGDAFANPTKEEKAALGDTKAMMYSKKAAEAFKKAFNKNPQNGIAAFNAGVIYYNDFNNFDDSARANRRALQSLNQERLDEKDPKKKAALATTQKPKIDALNAAYAVMDKPMSDAMDQAIEWIEKAYNSLKDKQPRSQTEKNCLNKSVDFLANIYAYKRDKMKGKDPKAYDALDAKFKQYDALHDTFK